MKTIFLPLLTLAILGVALDASAQITRTSSGGMFGGSSNAFGGGLSGLPGMSGGMGSSLPGMSSGMGSLPGMSNGIGGMNGAGGIGTSMNGMNGQNGMNGMGQQNGGFVGANTSGAFVGANANTGTQGMMGMGNRGLGGMNSYGMGGGMNSYGMGNRMMGQNPFGMGGYGNFGNQNNQRRQLVTAYRSDIQIAARPSANLSTSLTRQLRETPGVRSLSPLQVTQQGRTLILEGAVATDHDKLVVERLVRLEPGVDQVQNDLVVRTPSSSATPLMKSSSN
jgi:hypothetical protein